MLGLSIDKLLVVAIAAAIIIGPARLPGYAKRLGEIVRGLRAFLDDARARAEAETGLSRDDWRSLDPRQYDPRRIVREALAEPAEPPAADAPASATSIAAVVPDAAPSAPARRYIVTGDSAHPRRVLAEASDRPPETAGDEAPETVSSPASGGGRQP